LHAKDQSRIQQKIYCPVDDAIVDRSELVRGYEVEKNRYVIIQDEELDAVKLETTHTLDIERFVDADSIDRLFFDVPYILLPTDDIAVNAYAVIREAMKQTHRVALGRVVMHTRERLMAMEPLCETNPTLPAEISGTEITRFNVGNFTPFFSPYRLTRFSNAGDPNMLVILSC